jgi:hypothetical protein
MLYKIKEGRSYWIPRKFKILLFFKKITWTTEPNTSMIFDYQGDKDWMDWKKIGGISLVNFSNLFNIFIKNRDSIMLAWRYNNEIDLFEYAIYVNNNSKNIAYDKPDQLLKTKSSNVNLTIEKENGIFKCYLYENGENVNSINIKPRFNPLFFSLINPWYGGANNSEGPYGGKAPKDMECRIDLHKEFF